MNMEEWYQKLLKFLEARDRADQNLKASREKLAQAIIEYLNAYYEARRAHTIVRVLSEISLYVYRNDVEEVKSYLNNLDYDLMQIEGERQKAINTLEKNKHKVIEKIERMTMTSW